MVDLGKYAARFEELGIPLETAKKYADIFRDRYFVVKVGGDIIDNYGTKNGRDITVPEDIALMEDIGIRVIAVNGGKEAINQALEKDGEFIDGQRVTEPGDIAAIESALRRVNHDFCEQIEDAGGRAVTYERSLWAKPYSNKHGLTGRPTTFIRSPLESIINEYVVVASPVGSMENDPSVAANINADTAAGFIAGEIKAEKLIYLSVVDGVIIDGSLVSELSRAQAEEYIIQSLITEGAIPKVRYAIEAKDAGVESVHIISGYKRGAVIREVFSQEGIGTIITNGS